MTTRRHQPKLTPEQRRAMAAAWRGLRRLGLIRPAAERQALRLAARRPPP